MLGNKFSLNNLPPEGLDVVFDDQAIWEGPIAEFKMDIRIVEPFRVEVFIMPGPDGCLLRGKLVGEVAMPCDRCAEDAVFKLDYAFDNFEPMPSLSSEEEEVSDTDSGLISIEDGVPMLDIGALGWEEFVLSLPVKPLCGGSCQGLCPTCGVNRNVSLCKCDGHEDDPRLAPLRSVIIKSGNKNSAK